MATISERTAQDGSKSYRVEIRLKGAPRVSETFARKTDARKWASATETAIREGRHFGAVEAKRHTLGEAIARYTRDILPTKKASTVRDQARQLAWWDKHLGHRLLSAVTPDLIAEHRDLLSREPITPRQPTRNPDTPAKPVPDRFRGPATVNRYLAVMSHLLSVATREWRWIEANPLTRVTKPKEPRGRVRFLSEDELGPDGTLIPGELTRLLQACRESASPDLYPAAIMALSTGGRAQEIMGLRWPQVDFTRRVATLYDTKNGEIRLLPLAGLALELLRARAKVRRLDTDLVFPGRGRGPACRPVVLRNAFLLALKRAEITDFRWHDLRHSAASYLAMGGASPSELAEVLGHKTLAMVLRYAHLSPAHTARVVESMNERMFGAAS